MANKINDKIQELILLESLGFYLCDKNKKKAFIALNKASENGEGDKFASDFCQPIDLYEYDSVNHLLNQINGLTRQLNTFLKKVEKIKKA